MHRFPWRPASACRAAAHPDGSLGGCSCAGEDLEDPQAPLAATPHSCAGKAQGKGQEAQRHVPKADRELVPLALVPKVGPCKHLLGGGRVQYPAGKLGSAEAGA